MSKKSKNIIERIDRNTGLAVQEQQIPINFRWPVSQVDDNAIVVKVPVSKDSPPLLAPASITHLRETLKLSDQEIENMLDAAHEAAIREILIVK
jgi:hypothetical protein